MVATFSKLEAIFMQRAISETYHFLALVSQASVHIIKRKSSAFSRIYRDFYRSPPSGAEDFFLHDQKPGFFFLESAELTSSAAYGRMLAWARRWQAHGFTPVPSTVSMALKTSHPDDAAHDLAVSARSFFDIYCPEADLSTAISLSSTDPRIYLTLSKEDIQKLRKSAADVSMTLQEYCTAKIWDRPLPNPDLSELYSCLSQLRRTCTLMDNAFKTTLLSGKIEDAQTMVSMATSLNSELRQLRQLITTLHGGVSHDH